MTRHRMTSIGWLVVFAGLLFHSTVHSAGKEVGKTVSVVGKVLVSHQNESAKKPIVVPDPLFLRDQITSGVGSHAKFMLKDDSILKLGPSSHIELNEIVAGEQSQQSTLKQLKGRLRILLGKKLKPKSHFEVHTPVAVAGVRGTDFEVWVWGDGKTAVRCFEGEVAVKNILKNVLGEVLLIENQYTVVEQNQPPVAPIPISPDQSLASIFGEPEQSESDEQEDDSDNEQSQDDGTSADAGDNGENAATSGTSTDSAKTVTTEPVAAETTPSQSTPSGTESKSDAATSPAAASQTAQSQTVVTAPTSPSASGQGESSSAQLDYTSLLDQVEASLVIRQDYSASSAAGLTVLSQLGIRTATTGENAADEGADGSESNSSNESVTQETDSESISYSVADNVLDNVLDQNMGVGASTTIPEPLLDSKSVVFGVEFPTP